ncbi:uncharacterized protein Z520_01036 [Fonsecaea multimorphosa CBS 102226]|uniref:Uncharacterized protein n=1 Tax=Fonsecaea multimorphosa CBS 102226 TaxID=1442371 RepID=A0A0D2HKY9_9EURO|nr:uncharacterized protein Z520_01036 [Fonsecaea multimorphosa CBS 102226]KIY02571.1 hypothetical protein Z520_01036 [Fonsecaea multimorphosa CBS 102226]OAL31437.1 hypothetical protein AYO22_01029 [Fonsecaea multimorphosa]
MKFNTTTATTVANQIARGGITGTGRRWYTTTRATRWPTALHRAEKASDLKAHPEAAATQEKLPDKKGNRHWTEENATLSEEDIRADREAREEKASGAKPQQDKKA